MNRGGFGYEDRYMNVVARWGLAIVIAVGLGIDAYTHLDLAHVYTGVTTGTVNQAVLFRIEAIGAIVAGLLVLLRPNLATAAVAALVSGGGVFALLVYRFVQVGKIGPLPDMSEPFWYTEKSLSLTGELIALLASLALLGYSFASARRRPVVA